VSNENVAAVVSFNIY